MLRGVEAFLPLPSCPTHKAHYHLKGLETPSVPRILIYLTLRFPKSQVYPAQSPEGFRVSPQGPLCLERSVTTGTGPCSSAVTKSPPYSSLPLESSTGLGLGFPFSSSGSESCQVCLAPQLGLGTVGRKLKRAWPPMGFGSPQEDRGANVEPPHTGRAEQMAQRIMKIQLCSLLGRLSLQVGEAAPPNCAQNSQPPKTAYAKRLPVWRL